MTLQLKGIDGISSESYKRLATEDRQSQRIVHVQLLSSLYTLWKYCQTKERSLGLSSTTLKKRREGKESWFKFDYTEKKAVH